jgi:AcrR family transcriptional regulator
MSVQQRGEETRSRIRQAAEECFARYGYDGAGVAEICRRAGVTKGGFYYHFPTKQALFLDMLEQWLGSLDAQLEAVRSGAETVPEELGRMSGLIQQVFQEANGRLPIFLQFLTKAGHSPVVWQATVAPFRKYHAFFATMIQQGIAQGSFRPLDADLATRVLLSFGIGLLVQGLLDPQGADWGHVCQAGLQMLLQGLLNRPEQNSESEKS